LFMIILASCPPVPSNSTAIAHLRMCACVYVCIGLSFGFIFHRCHCVF
jgi:hypothetical protein